jgi:hypothetical protein
MISSVSYSRGQLKIQQMAFVLVAVMIFFALVSIFFFTVRIADLEESAENLAELEAQEIVRKLSTSAEFEFDIKRGCTNCVDVDKILVLKERQGYKDFWNLDYLAVERVSPGGKGECYRGIFPNCGTITIVNKTKNFGKTSSAFVSLCYWTGNQNGYVKCEIGKIHASGKGIND